MTYPESPEPGRTPQPGSPGQAAGPAWTGAPGRPPAGTAAPTWGFSAPPPPRYPYPGVFRPLPAAPSGAPLADFSERLLAFLLDALILTAAGLVVTIPAAIGMFALLFRYLEPAPDGTPVQIPAGAILQILAIAAGIVLVTLAMSYIYEVEMMFRRGQTIGKRVMKIKIIPLDPAAGPLTRGLAVRRWLIWRLAAAVVPFLQWLDGLWQLWDQPYRQCLHDKVAKTVVVKVVGAP